MPLKVFQVQGGHQTLIFNQQISSFSTSETRLRLCRGQDNAIELLDRANHKDDDLGGLRLWQDFRQVRLSCAAAREKLSHPDFPLPSTPTIQSQTFIFLEDRDTITLFLPSRPAPLPQTISQNGSCFSVAHTNPIPQAGPEPGLTPDTCVRLFFSITADVTTIEEPEYLIEDSKPSIEESQVHYDSAEADRPSYHSSYDSETEQPEPQSEDTKPTVQETQFFEAEEGTDRPSYSRSFNSQLSSSCCSDDDSLDTSVMQVERDAMEELEEGLQTRVSNVVSNVVKEENVVRSDNSETTHRCTSEELKEGLLSSAQDRHVKLETAQGDDAAPHEDDMDIADGADEENEKIETECEPTKEQALTASIVAEQAPAGLEQSAEDAAGQLDGVSTGSETEDDTVDDGKEVAVNTNITGVTSDNGAVLTRSASEIDDDDEELPDAHAMINSSARDVPQKCTTPQAADQQDRIEDVAADYEHDEHDHADQESSSDKPVEKVFASINKKAATKKNKSKGNVHAPKIATEDEDPANDEAEPPAKPQQKQAKAKAVPTKKRQSTGSVKDAREDEGTATPDSLFDDPADLPPLKKRRSSAPVGVKETPVTKKAAPKAKKTPKTPAPKGSQSLLQQRQAQLSQRSTTPSRPAVLNKFLGLGYKKAEHVSPQCDLLVVGAGALQKTVKLLIAVARGTAIVTDEFVTRSTDDGHVPAPSGYSPGGISDMGVSRDKLFVGKELYITPALREIYKYEYLNIVELTKIIGFKSTTSTAVRGLKKNADTIALGYGDDDINAITLMEEGTTCYTKDFLSASILRNEVDLDDEEFQMTLKFTSSKAASKTKSAQPVSKAKGSQPVSKARGAQKDKRRTKSM